MRLAHIALVTGDLGRTRALYERLGFLGGQVYEVEEQYPGEAVAHRYRAVALRHAPEARPTLWVMEPVGAAGPLARFLRQRGPGFHHLGLKTEDIAGEVDRLSRQGLAFLRKPHDFPQDGEIRALLSPRACDGVLIEIVQARERVARVSDG
ncbi:MAG TPA: VOC family protein [Methylomirabilota bacterium]|nr:VOC family protein [Methylomirabilota bacterium]